jgi:hypothetical protein
MGFVVDNWHWGRFSPNTSVTPTNHFIGFSTFIITSSGADIIRQIVAEVPSGLSLTPPQELKRVLTINTVK